MKVHIIEASHPDDFFEENLDGVSTHHLLNTMQVEHRLRTVLTLSYLKKAIAEAGGYDVLHLSCHGNSKGIGLPDDTDLSWQEFADLFPKNDASPALVMSACCGGSKIVATAFENHKHPPSFIFGSEKSLGFDTYAAAWALLYRTLGRKGLSKEVGQDAMEEITAVFHSSFVYRRWDADENGYLRYPGKDRRFVITAEASSE